MFTGIINHLGKLIKNKKSTFVFKAKKDFYQKLEKGMSVSANGTCLTVVDLPTKQSFSIDIMPETVSKTMFKTLKINDVVNLELPLTLNDFISGHLVQGHVDGIGIIKKIEQNGNSKILTISYPIELSKQIIKKGSITINGISLTVISVNRKSFNVGIIPFTYANTMLRNIKIGDMINIETDLIGKYIEKNLNKNN